MQRFFIPNSFLYNVYPDVKIEVPSLTFIWQRKKYVFMNVEPTILYDGYYGTSLKKKFPKDLLEFVKPVDDKTE